MGEQKTCDCRMGTPARPAWGLIVGRGKADGQECPSYRAKINSHARVDRLVSSRGPQVQETLGDVLWSEMLVLVQRRCWGFLCCAHSDEHRGDHDGLLLSELNEGREMSKPIVMAKTVMEAKRAHAPQSVDDRT